MKTDIAWTDTAWEWYKAVQNQHAEIGSYFGADLQNEHAAEFHTILERVTFAAGPVNIQTDGDGFLITTPHIVIGLVWTPDPPERMFSRLDERFKLNFDEIHPTWPRTGHWSAHS